MVEGEFPLQPSSPAAEIFIFCNQCCRWFVFLNIAKQGDFSEMKSAMNTTECIVFLVRYPEKGSVKTRLATTLGDEHAVGLYTCFILDMLATLETTSATICLCYTPDHAEGHFRTWLGNHHLYMAQQGHDLGERMRHAFQDAFQKGFERVLILGSDLPDLPSYCIIRAFDQLQTFDSVIGPSGDGGYYALGFQRATFCPEVFQDILWSHSSVCAETLKKLEQKNVTFFVLPSWNDIDNLDELQQWYTRNRSAQTTRAKHTMHYIQAKEVLLSKNIKE
jgi:rSAM/selenodomain-associated transferase 1